MKTLALCCLLFLFISGSANATITELHFATEATYPPFESIDQTGQIKGFDIEIAQALCAKMHVVCHISNAPFDSLIPSLQLGRYDALIGAIAITEIRKQQVDFSEPYYFNRISYVLPKDSKIDITKPSSLNNKIIGVQDGTTFNSYLNAVYGKAIKIKLYASLQNALLDLQARRIDAILGDNPVLTSWLKQFGNEQFIIVGKISDPRFFGAGNGIAVRKGQEELLQKINSALNEIKRDGTYEKIINKYFSAE